MTNNQTPMTNEAPKFNDQIKTNIVWLLKIGSWNFNGYWSLVIYHSIAEGLVL